MKQIGRFLFLTMMLILGGIGSNIFGQNLIEVFDGRESDFGFPRLKDTSSFGILIKAQEADIKADLKKHLPADCGEISIYPKAVLEGSFTKPRSSQKAYVYYGTCRELTLSKSANLIMITENDKIVFNQFYSTDNIKAVKKLPDINKNKLSELIFISSYGSDVIVMDYSETWLDIVEFSSSDSFNYLGRATTYSWAGLSAAKDEKGIPNYIPRGYKIFVKPSTNPIFSRETYRDIKDEKTKETKWVLNKPLEKFALTKN